MSAQQKENGTGNELLPILKSLEEVGLKMILSAFFRQQGSHKISTSLYQFKIAALTQSERLGFTADQVQDFITAFATLDTLQIFATEKIITLNQLHRFLAINDKKYQKIILEYKEIPVAPKKDEKLEPTLKLHTESNTESLRQRKVIDTEIVTILALSYQGLIDTIGRLPLEEGKLKQPIIPTELLQIAVDELSELTTPDKRTTQSSVKAGLNLIQSLVRFWKQPNFELRIKVESAIIAYRAYLLEQVKLYGYKYLFEAIATTDQLMGDTNDRATIIDRLKAALNKDINSQNFETTFGEKVSAAKAVAKRLGSLTKYADTLSGEYFVTTINKVSAEYEELISEIVELIKLHKNDYFIEALANCHVLSGAVTTTLEEESKRLKILYNRSAQVPNAVPELSD